MKRIPLTQGQFALVDDDLFDYLNQRKWRMRKAGNIMYARTDESGQWRLPLIAGLTYTLIFVDNWRGRQEYVEERYYIPFCDSVYFGESDCIE